MKNTRIQGFAAQVIDRSKIAPYFPEGHHPMEWGLPHPTNTEAFSVRAFFKEWDASTYNRDRVSVTENWNKLVQNKTLESEALKIFSGIMENAGMHLPSDTDDYLVVTSPNFIGYASTNRSGGYLYLTIFTRQTATQEASNG